MGNPFWFKVTGELLPDAREVPQRSMNTHHCGRAGHGTDEKASEQERQLSFDPILAF